jgi:hypothetical protein
MANPWISQILAFIAFAGWGCQVIFWTELWFIIDVFGDAKDNYAPLQMLRFFMAVLATLVAQVLVVSSTAAAYRVTEEWRREREGRELMRAEFKSDLKV